MWVDLGQILGDPVVLSHKECVHHCQDLEREKNETFGLEFSCHRLLVGSWVARQEAVDVVGWTDATLIGLLQLPNGFVKTK